MCEICHSFRSKRSNLGNLCWTCYQKRKLATDPQNRIEQIQRRKPTFKIEERVIAGQLVRVKICPPASAEGCRAGLRTVDFVKMPHAKTPKHARGKFRRT